MSNAELASQVAELRSEIVAIRSELAALRSEVMATNVDHTNLKGKFNALCLQLGVRDLCVPLKPGPLDGTARFP